MTWEVPQPANDAVLRNGSDQWRGWRHGASVSGERSLPAAPSSPSLRPQSAITTTMLMSYSGGVSTVSTSSMSHMSSLKSQFMETDAWSSFLSDSLYSEDSSGSGDSVRGQDHHHYSPPQTLPDSSEGELSGRKIRRKHPVHKVGLTCYVYIISCLKQVLTSINENIPNFSKIPTSFNSFHTFYTFPKLEVLK